MSERTRLHYPTVYVVHTEDKNRYKSVPDYTVYVGETKVAAARDHVENGLTKAEVMAMLYFVKLRWTCSALNLDTVGVQLEHRRRLVPCFVVCLVYFMRECLFR